jgi:hypothetical protein
MKITTEVLVACLPLGKLALSFEPNRGQTDPRIQSLSYPRTVALAMRAGSVVGNSKEPRP